MKMGIVQVNLVVGVVVVDVENWNRLPCSVLLYLSILRKLLTTLSGVFSSICIAIFVDIGYLSSQYFYGLVLVDLYTAQHQ